MKKANLRSRAPAVADGEMMARVSSRAVTVGPGLVLAAGLGAVALTIAHWTPNVFGPVLIAVLLGLAARNVVGVPAVFSPGLSVATKRVLRIGVILLGARLSLGDVVNLGARALLIAVVCMAVAIGAMGLLARVLRIPPRLAVLLGVGTAVCGNSAIMATAPIVEAEEKEISFAVGTITVFGTVSLLLFPLVGRLLALPDEVFGFWVGLSINDTSQVVAAGAAYSPRALEVATVVKLVRNALMAPLILAIAWWSVRSRLSSGDADGKDVWVAALKAFPLFVLGFLVLAAANSVGAISGGASSNMSRASEYLIVMAIGAVGLMTRLTDIRSVGGRAVLAAVGAASLLAVLGFAFSHYLFA